ncbi:hypothetical protein CYMTET_51602 [Cymbomonas tetramitiformis]|uniref:Uncharacterized protein n=1 Tax=Cymbomonas tetramitiformis TaxID=36881 RepID=A0AAE0BLW1_9CHLO|nr:hypothetical protein CYMTET_51602 [Cymbomonas tetramitiformis]
MSHWLLRHGVDPQCVDMVQVKRAKIGALKGYRMRRTLEVVLGLMIIGVKIPLEELQALLGQRGAVRRAVHAEKVTDRHVAKMQRAARFIQAKFRRFQQKRRRGKHFLQAHRSGTPLQYEGDFSSSDARHGWHCSATLHATVSLLSISFDADAVGGHVACGKEKKRRSTCDIEVDRRSALGKSWSVTRPQDGIDGADLDTRSLPTTPMAHRTFKARLFDFNTMGHPPDPSRADLEGAGVVRKENSLPSMCRITKEASPLTTATRQAARGKVSEKGRRSMHECRAIMPGVFHDDRIPPLDSMATGDRGMIQCRKPHNSIAIKRHPPETKEASPPASVKRREVEMQRFNFLPKAFLDKQFHNKPSRDDTDIAVARRSLAKFRRERKLLTVT